MPKKYTFIVFPAIMVAVLSVIIIYKAATVPATYDEVTTSWNYTGFFKIPAAVFNAGNNPNNHILNSLSITFCQLFLGFRLWTLRLPNVLSFFLFSACMFVLAKKYFNSSLLLFCLPFACMFLNPYLIDFYSLARGYGMANALMACSIVCLLVFSSSKVMKWYYLTIVFAALAAYANFSFLMYWLAVHVLLLGNLWVQKHDAAHIKRTLKTTFYMALAFVALCYIPVTSIQQSMRSGPYSVKNFYQDTVMGEVDRFIYGKPFFVFCVKYFSKLVVLIIVMAGINSYFKIRKNLSSVFTDPFNLVFILLLLVWIINIIQAHLSDTDYPYYRTGLIYYVLFIFVFIFLLRDIAMSRIFGTQMALGLTILFFVLHFASCVNLKSVYEWSYDAYTGDVMDYMYAYRSQHPEIKIVGLNLTNCLRNSFNFYQQVNNTDWLIIAHAKNDALANNKADTASQTLFYYTADCNIAALKNYTIVKKFRATGMPVPLQNAGNELTLLIHK